MALGHGHGRMSINMKVIRFLIVILNITFILAGLILLAISIYVVKDPKMQQLRPLLNPEIVSTYSQGLSTVEIFAFTLIALGGVLLLIGFLGCCGAMKGFRFLHVLYSVVVGIIIVAEIIIIVLFFVYQNRFRTQVVTKLQDSIAKYYVGTPMNNSISINSTSLSWDFTQFNLQCCGAINKNDFLRASHWNRNNPYQPTANLVVPFTCCPLNVSKSWIRLPTNFSTANTCATTGSNAYSQGCYDRLVDILTTYKNYVIIGGIIIGIVEMLAVVFAILLYRRQEEYDTLSI